MKIYKKTARKDPSGRCVHTCDGVDYVRRKSADGTFKFRKASESASKSATKSKAAVTKRRYSGGADGYLEVPGLQKVYPEGAMMPWTNAAGAELYPDLEQFLNDMIGASMASNDPVSIRKSSRYKMFSKFLKTRIAAQKTGVAFRGIQIIEHDPIRNLEKRSQKKRDLHPVELRLLLWFSNDLSSNDYYHFTRPKNARIRKLYEWIGHRGGDRDGAAHGIVGVNRNHTESVIMSKEEFQALRGPPGDNYENDPFEDPGEYGAPTQPLNMPLNPDSRPFNPGQGVQGRDATAKPFSQGLGKKGTDSAARKFLPKSVLTPASAASAAPGSYQVSLPPDLPESKSRSRSRSGTSVKAKPSSGSRSYQGSLPQDLTPQGMISLGTRASRKTPDEEQVYIAKRPSSRASGSRSRKTASGEAEIVTTEELPKTRRRKNDGTVAPRR